MSFVAVAIGGAAVIGGAASLITSSAQGDIANKQLTAAQQALQQQMQARSQGISQAQQAAAMSPQEAQSIQQILTTTGQGLAASQASLQKQQSLLDQASPQVQAAGQDLHDLLVGKSAAILAPLQQNLDMQRNKLTSQLAAQMGPGFMTSSAGIQALTQFDNQASLTINNAQMNAIQTVGAQYGGLLGVQQSGQQGLTQLTQSAYNQAQLGNTAALQGAQVVQGRELNATLGAMGANPLNQQGPVNYAGAGSVGQLGMGQGLSQLAQGLGATGTNLGAQQNFGQYLSLMGGKTAGGGVTSSQIAGVQMPSVNFGQSANSSYSSGFGASIAGGL